MRFVALALVLLVAASLPSFLPDGADRQSAAFVFGLALIAATLTGGLFEAVGLPRVSGYLIFGLACGPYVADIISASMARKLQLLNGLAVTLIAFIAGLELNFARLQPRIRTMLRLGTTVLVLLYPLFFGLFWAAWPLLPVAPEMTGWARVAGAALLTCIVVSFSPTVTLAVIAESRSRGPLSELVLAVVVLADLALIVLFTLVMQLARWATSGGAGLDAELLARLVWEVAGSIALGAAVGALFGLYLRLVGRELTLALLGVCVILSGAGQTLHLEPLLAALAAGLVVENIARPEGDALKHAVERGALPVLVVFFAGAGASLHLDALLVVGPLAVFISLARLLAVRVTTRGAARAAGVPSPEGPLVWTGLVSQAGVTLGLTILVASEFPGWGRQMQTLAVALITIHELIGPVLFRRALQEAGEVGAMDTTLDDGDVGPEVVRA